MTTETNDGAIAPADDAALFSSTTGNDADTSAAVDLAAVDPKPAPTPAPEPVVDNKPPAETTGMRELREAYERQVRRNNELEQRYAKPAEPKPAPDIFENPNEAIRSTVAPQFEEMQQTMLAMAKDYAELKHTPEKVSAAEAAFIQAMQARTLDPADYQKVVTASNRYTAAVQWHQRQQVQKEIGDDPAAYREKLKAELLKDPEFAKTVLESTRTQAQQSGNNVSQRPVLTSIPSLTKVGTAALASNQDEPSDAELFHGTTSRKRT